MTATDAERTSVREAVQVSLLTTADLPNSARIHRDAFRESALSRMGLEAIRRYYAWLLTGPHQCVALGAWKEGVLVGFCFGGTFYGALSGFVRANRVFLLRKVLWRPWLLADPLFRERIRAGLRILRVSLIAQKPKPEMTARAQTVALPSPGIRSFGILSIGVHPRYQGRGVGRRLMEEAERIAAASGFQQMDLSVHPANLQAVRFYENQGWEKEVWDGEWRGEMRKKLTGPTPP